MNPKKLCVALMMLALIMIAFSAFATDYDKTVELNLTLGEEFNVEVYRDEVPFDGETGFGASQLRSKCPEWLYISSTPNEESPHRAYLEGTAKTAGDWTITVRVHEIPNMSKDRLRLATIRVKIHVSPDADGNKFIPKQDYMGDGAGMLVLVQDNVNFRFTAGGESMGWHRKGDRMPYVRRVEAGGHEWYYAFSNSYGYGFIRSDMVRVEKELACTYRPGEPLEYTIWRMPFPKVDPDKSVYAQMIMSEIPSIKANDRYLQVGRERSDLVVKFCCTIPESGEYRIKVALCVEENLPLEVTTIKLTAE